MSASLLAVLMVFSIPLVAIVGGVALVALKMFSGDRSRKGGAAEEARLIQDLHHGLRKMEDRIDALETIVLEHERKGTSNDT